MNSLWIQYSLLLIFIFATSACQPQVSETSQAVSTASTSASTQRFADGVKAVRINTRIDPLASSPPIASFAIPTSTPFLTTIPSNFPGAGVGNYRAGISPTVYFDLNGTTQISKPDWLLDFQLGITGTGNTGCAVFGGAGQLDSQHNFRTSEEDCGASFDGVGNSNDKVFMRIILDRTATKIGSAENLVVQIEYQASGIHFNSWGSGTTVDSQQDQVWKVFWDSTLAYSGTTPSKILGLFVPPNYAACEATGDGSSGVGCSPGTHRGSAVQVKQIVIPLSAYPTLSVVQISRIISHSSGAEAAAVSAFCTADSPLCLGVVIHSVSLFRM